MTDFMAGIFSLLCIAFVVWLYARVFLAITKTEKYAKRSAEALEALVAALHK